MTRNILLIGSIPLASAAEVFDVVGRELDGLVRRVPDGEIGERHDWVAWQSAAFSRIPFVERVEAARLVEVGGEDLPRGPQYRVRPGFPTAAVRFGPLGYAEAAVGSYAAFRAARAAGAMPSDCRFQVGIATALSVVGQYVDGAFQAAIEPAYEQRLLEEVDEIARLVPHGDLAVQWNLATELSIIEGRRPVYFDKVWDGIFERVVRACERVPAGVELGLHFCFRDFEYHGFPLPADLDGIVDLANGLSGSVGRSIEWMHFPVPAGVTDPAYFAPLRRLTRRDETDLYLGVIHTGVGIAETAKQVACAASAIPGFGIACECGFGDIAASEVPKLLRDHRACAEAG
jgi:hypothetical protein